MKKFALATATATALTLAMANVAFAQTAQAPMTLAAGENDQSQRVHLGHLDHHQSQS